MATGKDHEITKREHHENQKIEATAAAAAKEKQGNHSITLMFEKVVTPSDVGKLNRLVIPKKNAVKYFPLDPSKQVKGLELSFEDRIGKKWQFRYSYWKSSQSYVMTKGWSRFVRDKKLDAGDTVSFGHRIGVTGDKSLFIDWRRHRREAYKDAKSSSALAFPLINPPLMILPFMHSMLPPIIPFMQSRAKAPKQVRLFGVDLESKE
ncbi:hypothetical protein J5N97_029333 [Dioscorea zingiberensis]|uniref:TF-B3 domain-containing protein n=1 Tax=Dioscorea zingiberensis TaxID=325984 RepID=A0A9D5C0J4_9LILI|nr:hypothetical protein J5N97_029333 [Dioscorea zingiberensis]